MKMQKYLAIVLLIGLVMGMALVPVKAAQAAKPYAPDANALRISQVYGGAGCGTVNCSTYQNDFIELFNAGGTTISLNGLSVQYAAAAGTSWQVTSLPNVNLAPGAYFLVAEAYSANGQNALPTADATGSIAMAATAGKVALVNGVTALTVDCPLPGSLDFVGYGSTASCREGSGNAPAPSTTTADLRANQGCTDADQNNTDFAAGAPTPRNTASATRSCPDAPPTVSTTIPANGAAGVSPNATLTVNFNEIVDLTAGAVTLDCNGTVTLTGLPANDVSSITLTPASALPVGVTCTANVVAAAVTDNDGTPETMTANYPWSFTVTAPADLVISQVYGGGGNGGTTYRNDFIELFNRGSTTINLAGWSVQYASAAGTTWSLTALSGSIAPGQYYLVQEAQGTGGTTALPIPDAIGSMAMSASDGKVALVHSASALSGACPAGLADVVGYGSANCSEGGTPVAALTNTTAALRAGGGCTDTNQNTADFTASAPLPRNTASPTNACSGDNAPAVSATTPANGATGVAVNANISVNFSEPVNVSGTWFDLTCTASGSHTANVTGVNPATTFSLDPVVDFALSESCTLTLYAAQISDNDALDPPDTLAANYTATFSTPGAPPPCSTIPLIQGTGNASTCTGYRANITGCVTGVAASGFYMQDVSGDGNDHTSDGIYVYMGGTWSNPSNWAPGHTATVSGIILEYYNMTEFQSGSSVTYNSGAACALPTPVAISPVADPAADPMALYERFEGMRVQMSFDGWVVGPTKRFDSRYPSGDPEIAFVDFSSAIADYSRVFESDYPGYQGINYLSGGLNFDLPDLDFGDALAGTNITGILGYQFDKYTLLVDATPTLTIADNPNGSSAQTIADPARREFDICSYNVENLFDNINDGVGDWGDWAPGYPTPNTPTGAAAYQAHVDETAAVLYSAARSCTVIGLEEMEGKQAVYNNLAAALSGLDAAHNWTAIYVESGDSRDISQGFLYREDVALVSGPTAVSGATYAGWTADGALDFVRVPASARFRFFAGTNAPVDVTAYAVHMKSKGSSGSCGTPDCTDRRELEAADLRDILAHHQLAGEFAVAGGDFNDVIGSSPIHILDASQDIYGLFADLPANQQYSYIFNGESEVLDHIYLTRNMLAANGFGWEHAFSPVHVNADFPTSEHASDHDPLRVRFLGSDLSDLPASYGQAWHALPHQAWLGSSVTHDPAFAAGEDNTSDDGVTRLSGNWQPATSVTIRVTVSGSGNAWLTGWFDWNLDGDFDDLGEKAVNQPVAVGANTIPLTVPAGASVGRGSSVSLPSRFRLYESAIEPSGPISPDAPTAPDASTTGGAIGGEVEDYLWSFSPTAVELSYLAAQPIPTRWFVGLAALALLVVILAAATARRFSSRTS